MGREMQKLWRWFMRNKIAIIVAISTTLVQAPIYIYLMVQVLKRIQATELMWFLFWIYVPISIITSLLVKLFLALEEK